MLKIWFDLDLSNTVDFISIFPIYSRITFKIIDDKKAIFKCSIHEKLLLESQIKMEHRAVDSSLISHITSHQVKENENENRILQVSLDADITVSENGSIT